MIVMDTNGRRPEIDSLLTGEYSLSQVAGMVAPMYRNGPEHTRLSKQRIHQYLKGTGQLELFNSNRNALRQERENRKRLLAALGSAIVGYAVTLAGQESNAMAAATEYVAERRRSDRSPPPASVLAVVKCYESEARHGRRNVTAAARRAGISYTNAYNALVRAGLKPGSRRKAQRL